MASTNDVFVELSNGSKFLRASVATKDEATSLAAEVKDEIAGSISRAHAGPWFEVTPGSHVRTDAIVAVYCKVREADEDYNIADSLG